MSSNPDRKLIAAQAARAARFKRKLERQHLVERNDELVTERARFLQVISKLKAAAHYLEFAQLAGHAGFEYTTLLSHNKKLKVEVLRHKKIVTKLEERNQNLLTEIDSTPPETSRGITRYKELEDQSHQVVQSAIQQVLGMCSASILQRSKESAIWSSVRFRHKSEGPLAGLHCVVRYRYHYAAGKKRCQENVKRLNLRLDFFDIPMEQERIVDTFALPLEQKIQKMSSDVQKSFDGVHNIRDLAYSMDESSSSPISFKCVEYKMSKDEVTTNDLSLSFTVNRKLSTAVFPDTPEVLQRSMPDHVWEPELLEDTDGLIYVSCNPEGTVLGETSENYTLSACILRAVEGSNGKRTHLTAACLLPILEDHPHNNYDMLCAFDPDTGLPRHAKNLILFTENMLKQSDKNNS